MSRQIFRDIEEALSREVRRITFTDDRTRTRTVLQDTFDPFTGELVQLPIEASYYDSSADANNVNYPYFFIKLVKTREDRFSNREVSSYGQDFLIKQNTTSPKAYEIVLGSADGAISVAGNSLNTSIYQISKAQAGYLIRILSNDNKGTYKISSVTISNSGNHTITVSNDLLEALPEFLFESTNRTVTFASPVDLNTIKVGDVFQDFSAVNFNITAINIQTNSLTLDGALTPNLSSGSKITRSGNVFTTVASNLRYLILDPSKPVTTSGLCGTTEIYSSSLGVNAQIPLDAYYLIRIDSKERDTHIDVLNRVWEEYNPPRSGLPVIIRSADSAESKLSADVLLGGSSTITVQSNSEFNLNDPVYIFDDLSPSKSNTEAFERPFESKIIGKLSNNQLVLADSVPDTYKVNNNAKVVSNAEYRILMFHFVDHNTRDVESAQYWVHEFTFWVQLWVARGEEDKYLSVIQDITTPIENIDGSVVYIEDDP